MAYALFNSGAAQAYANSFRQRTPYGGFENIKSDVGKETLGKIPFLNFQAEVEMAKAGLKEFGAATRQKTHDDATIEVAKMKYEAEADARKRGAMARFAGGSGSMARRTGGASYLQMIDPKSPLVAATEFTNQNIALDRGIGAQQAGFNAGQVNGINSIPAAGAGGRGPVNTPRPQAPLLPTDPLTTVERPGVEVPGVKE